MQQYTFCIPSEFLLPSFSDQQHTNKSIDINSEYKHYS